MTRGPQGLGVPTFSASDSITLAASRYRRERSAHWDHLALLKRSWAGAFYRRSLTRIYRAVIPTGLRVLEIGCGRGDLLAALAPSFGVGVDFSAPTLAQAAAAHPGLHFVRADAHDLPLKGPFDVIVLSDLVNDLWDVQAVLARLTPLVRARSRLIVNVYSRLWELPLRLVRFLRLGRPDTGRNWLTVDDLKNLLRLSGFESVTRSREILCPVPIPLLSGLLNRGLVKIWPFLHLALSNFIIARPSPRPLQGRGPAAPSVSVIVPMRNESGNVAGLLARTPEMGAGTEIIFVEGHSRDDTYAAVERALAAHPERRCRLLKQTGEGKGDAVRLGFAQASGNVLMILDADMTVPPEDLSRFYDALVSGRGELVNGVRLVYPRQRQSMRFLNMLGNKTFGLAFSWLLGQPVKDTLCGTKALWRRDYELIAGHRDSFGDFDPFGDFDLLFGAARFGIKIVDMPIRYQERRYGTTNIRRWRHGFLLLRMTFFAARRLKFR